MSFANIIFAFSSQDRFYLIDREWKFVKSTGIIILLNHGDQKFVMVMYLGRGNQFNASVNLSSFYSHHSHHQWLISSSQEASVLSYC